MEETISKRDLKYDPDMNCGPKRDEK
jgi:hypothetical protein